MEDQPSPTRESDLDHDFAITLFDELIDKYQAGEITYAEAIGQYTVEMLVMYDGQPGTETLDTSGQPSD